MARGAAALVLERTESFGGFLRTLARPGCPPALFHCSAGKDRAGWAASCLLLALGVEQEHVIEHYLLSNETFDPDKQRHALPVDEAILELLAPLMKVRADYARAAIDAANERWGSIDAYLHEGLGLTDTHRHHLRANWLEERGRS